MSVKERIEKLNRHAADQEEISRRERERLEAAASARISEEMPRVQEQQHVLLERLRSFGVLAMIEEMTEERIPSIIQEEVTVSPPKSLADLCLPSKEEVEEALRPKEWSATVQYPHPHPRFEADKWDEILQIVVVKNSLGYGFPMLLLDIDKPRITVRYNKERVLTIAGREITFSGSIPADKVERVEILEEAFAKAFENPERKQPRRSEPSHRFGEPIGARA